VSVVTAPALARISALASIRPRWIGRPITDLAIAFCWLPASVLGLLLNDNVHALRTFVGIVFIVSFLHQPLTLGLVYGDGEQFNRRRLMYLITPPIAFAAVLIGRNISLAMVGVIAGAWNIEHTLMQRYGLMRIYGRKGGDEHGRIEKTMLISWLVAVMTWLVTFADLEGLIVHIGMGATNAGGVRFLSSGRPVLQWLLVPVIGAAAWCTWRWVRAEIDSPTTRNPAKYAYVLSTALLMVLMVVNPIAGFAGYVAGHSLEYFAIVHRSLSRRAATGDSSAVARATRSPLRRGLVYGGYGAVIGAFIWATGTVLPAHLYGFAILFLGALHIFYDGFVWKLGRPKLAASLGI
jgi:hypothetical protein